MTAEHTIADVLDGRAKITAIAPYFGGKRTLAPTIVEEIGSHAVYWEPFAGSLAVLFAKPRSRAETVNDLHGEIVNLASVVASDRWEQLRDRLFRTAFCEPLFHAVRARLRDGKCSDDLDRAYCFFVESWMGRNGVAGTRASNTAFCVRFTANGGDPARRFASAVDSIASWHERLRGVWILQRDAFGLLPRIEDAPGTAIYCDPPYLVKGAKYVHDFADGQHEELARELCRFRQARIVVSYYDHPQLPELYPDWTRREIDVSKAMAHQGRRGGNDQRATEVLLLNGPSYGEPDRSQRELFTEAT